MRLGYGVSIVIDDMKLEVEVVSKLIQLEFKCFYMQVKFKKMYFNED